MSALDDIVDRAIDFVGRALRAMPSYRPAAIAGLRQLRNTLSQHSASDPAIGRLEAYLEALERDE